MSVGVYINNLLRENLSDTDLKYMIERLNLLDDKLPLAFTEEDSSVYIG